MVVEKNFPDNKRITVIFRVEPGSLGPDGNQYIDDFCQFAQQQLQACAEPYINWSIVPRRDKKMAEIAFQLANKKLTPAQAGQFLLVFGLSFEHFEAEIESNLEAIINQYFGR